MKLHFTSVLLCVASVLPAISCSRSKTDSWSPGEPRVEWDKQESMSLLEPTKRVVPVNAKIVFPADPIATIQVDTECKSQFKDNIENRAFSVTARDRNELEIAKLLPDHIWRQFEYTRLGKVNCWFKFKAASINGSQWTFSVHGLEVSDFARLENFKYRPYDRDSFKGDDVGYNLACEYFQNSRRSSKSDLVGNIVREVAEGPVANRFGATDAHDSRLRYTVQRCRVSIDRVGMDGLPERYVSQIFNFQFKPPAVEIKATLGFPNTIAGAQLNGERVLEVKLTNHSPAAVAYRLFDVKANNLSVQFVVFRAPNTYRIEEQYNVTLHYNIENASTVIADGENRVLVIGPWQTAKVTATVSAAMACKSDVFQSHPENFERLFQQGLAYVGYLYGFPNGRFMERLLNWNTEKPDLNAPVLNADLLKASNFDPKAVLYPGWAPLQSWIVARRGDRPPSISFHSSVSDDLCGPRTLGSPRRF